MLKQMKVKGLEKKMACIIFLSGHGCTNKGMLPEVYRLLAYGRFAVVKAEPMLEAIRKRRTRRV